MNKFLICNKTREGVLKFFFSSCEYLDETRPAEGLLSRLLNLKILFETLALNLEICFWDLKVWRLQPAELDKQNSACLVLFTSSFFFFALAANSGGKYDENN